MTSLRMSILSAGRQTALDWPWQRTDELTRHAGPEAAATSTASSTVTLPDRNPGYAADPRRRCECCSAITVNHAALVG
jgi:hypothetical protein